jgi:hypothetical protein
LILFTVGLAIDFSSDVASPDLSSHAPQPVEAGRFGILGRGNIDTREGAKLDKPKFSVHKFCHR